MPDSASVTWQFVRFGLLVTGKGEELFLPRLFRSLIEAAVGRCYFEVIEKVEQLRPRTSPRKHLKVTGKGGGLVGRDEGIAIKARGYLDRHPRSFVILIDDLEAHWVSGVEAVFQRYRIAFDTILKERKRLRIIVDRNPPNDIAFWV